MAFKESGKANTWTLLGWIALLVGTSALLLGVLLFSRANGNPFMLWGIAGFALSVILFYICDHYAKENSSREFNAHGKRLRRHRHSH